MTVSQLQEKLNQYPPNMEVFMETFDENFDYEPIDELEIKKITFSEENRVKSEPWAEEECLVLK